MVVLKKSKAKVRGIVGRNGKIVGINRVCRRVKKMSPVSILLKEKLEQAKLEKRKPALEVNQYGILVFAKSNRKRKSMREEYLEEQGYDTNK
jgi:hypothetical protein